MGVYTCTVSAWGVNGQGEMVKLAEQQSAQHTVRWVAKRKDALFFLFIYSLIYMSIYVHIYWCNCFCCHKCTHHTHYVHNLVS